MCIRDSSTSAYKAPPFGARAQNALIEFAALLDEWIATERRGHYDLSLIHI